MDRIVKLLPTVLLSLIITPCIARAGYMAHLKCPAGMVPVGDKFCVDKYEYPNRKGEYSMNAATWQAAETMCAREGKRLCTGSEWQEACAGPRGFHYPYGDTYLKAACSDAYAPDGAGHYPSGEWKACVSGYGAADMSGNLSEWTADSYNDGTKGLRGGSAVTSDPTALSCSAVAKDKPANAQDYYGFRCCITLMQGVDRRPVSPLVSYLPFTDDSGLFASAEYTAVSDVVRSVETDSYVDADGYNLTAGYQFDAVRLDYTRVSYLVKSVRYGLQTTSRARADLFHGALVVPISDLFDNWTGNLALGARYIHNEGGSLAEAYIYKEFIGRSFSFTPGLNYISGSNTGDILGYTADIRFRLNRNVDVFGTYNYGDLYKVFINELIVPCTSNHGTLECIGCRKDSGSAGLIFALPRDMGSLYVLYYDMGDLAVPLGGIATRF